MSSWGGASEDVGGALMTYGVRYRRIVRAMAAICGAASSKKSR